MKLSERLQKNKTTNKKVIEPDNLNSNKFSIQDIFADSVDIKNMVLQLAQNKRNIILAGNRSFDKVIIADYIDSIIKNKCNVKRMVDFDEKSKDLHGKINIIAGPNIQTVVKIMEQTIYGCQAFIFGLTFGDYGDIINKIKALIAVNFPNLSSTDIITLIAALNAAVIYISKNDDGLFFISGIDEIKYNKTNTDLELVNLLNRNSVVQETEAEIQTETEQEPEKKVEVEVKEEPAVETEFLKQAVPQIEEQLSGDDDAVLGCNTGLDDIKIELEEQPENKTEEQIVQPTESQHNAADVHAQSHNTGLESSILEEINPIVSEFLPKPNKYQLLKEKIKKKKLEEQNQINQKV